MRVIVNGVSAIKPKTGVGHTTVYLHRALCKQSRADSFWLYPGEWISTTARRMLQRPKVVSSPTKSNSIAGTARLTELAKAAYRAHFQAAARWGNFDLYHEPNFVPIRTHLPTVVTVHDLSVLLHPEWHPADRVAFHEKHFRKGIDAAEHVIVVSRAVRREMIEVMGMPPDRVSAIHNGIGEQYFLGNPGPQQAAISTLAGASGSRPGLPSRYLLAVGTIEPRKNLLTLLKAFCDLPAEARSACPLVIAGGWGWKSEPERELFETQAKPRGAIHLGYVADADLPALYSNAEALLYPSFYEGFGLPPVEMLACGGGVIASTAAAVREVVGGHAMLLDPHDLTGWRDAMLKVIREPDCLEDFRRGGVPHARRFSWERAAENTLGVYRRVLGQEKMEVKQLKRAA
ncbi:MAG TPA: glycosyltransferase family 1 protein, partial [Urbifossiella sp.]|jgi:alpha-1,3-rhamnosyl/mannosyltransferase